jgi:transcriptional regulator with XRE-family HTH domain
MTKMLASGVSKNPLAATYSLGRTAKEPNRMTQPPDLSIVLTFLRSGQGWTQTELGNAAGVSPNLLNDYERGRKPLHRSRLEHLVAAMGLPPETVEATLTTLHSNRASASPPGETADRFEAGRRNIEAVAARSGRMTADFTRSLFTLLTREAEALKARQQAAALWTRLKRHTAEERRGLVEGSLRFRTWALCERVAAESIAAAPNHPRQALELAELARRMAELAPVAGPWRSRLQGYAWAHVSNARRVCNDLPGAEKAMREALRLWAEGEEPGFLAEAWVPWIEAGLRKGQRRFPEALKRIDEALALDRGELRAQILVTKTGILETLGDPEGSTAVLQEVAPLIDSHREPRLAFGVRFNLLVDLCRLGRAAEAEPGLPVVRDLAERLGEELDLVRVAWLAGKIAAGLGRNAEAYAAFQRIRREFTARELAYDGALVSLELALLLLEQGRAAEVHNLASEMLWIFRAQGVHREALAAIQLFCDAVRREEATAELARRVVLYLYRAQHDPELRFEAGEADTSR